MNNEYLNTMDSINISNTLNKNYKSFFRNNKWIVHFYVLNDLM